MFRYEWLEFCPLERARVFEIRNPRAMRMRCIFSRSSFIRYKSSLILQRWCNFFTITLLLSRYPLIVSLILIICWQMELGAQVSIKLPKWYISTVEKKCNVFSSNECQCHFTSFYPTHYCYVHHSCCTFLVVVIAGLGLGSVDMSC